MYEAVLIVILKLIYDSLYSHSTKPIALIGDC